MKFSIEFTRDVIEALCIATVALFLVISIFSTWSYYHYVDSKTNITAMENGYKQQQVGQDHIWVKE